MAFLQAHTARIFILCICSPRRGVRLHVACSTENFASGRKTEDGRGGGGGATPPRVLQDSEREGETKKENVVDLERAVRDRGMDGWQDLPLRNEPQNVALTANACFVFTGDWVVPFYTRIQEEFDPGEVTHVWTP